MEVYLTLLWLHIVAAALLFGLLAVFPFLPPVPAHGHQERLVVRHMLRFLETSSSWLLVPSIVVLFLTGLLMTLGPFSEWEIFGREGQWIVVGMFLWTLVAGIVGGLVLGVVKEMKSLEERGEVGGPRMAKLWKQFRWGYAAGALVSLATIWVMVFQPTFF